MRRFDFRFQRVLDVKERIEDARKAALGQVVGAC
jgi:flagellar biosynthesis chaperone FliJ